MNENIAKNNVMIIDDDIGMMDAMSVVLKQYNVDIVPFTEPIAALETLKSSTFDVLIINYLMNPVRGDEIVKLVREFNTELYIILMSAHKDFAPSVEKMRSLDIQAYFEKSSRLDQLILLIESGFKYINSLRNIKEMSHTIEIHAIELATILNNTVGAKDNLTKGHSDRVAMYAEMFGKHINLSKKDQETLKMAAQFHDIGKIGISDAILLKTGTLTKEEYEHIKMHPSIGTNILSSSDIFKDSLPAIRGHHEQYDGTGYPDGLKGDKIPYLARILAICDAFDAITSARSYRNGMSLEHGTKELQKHSGSQFDPEIAKAFIDCLNSNKNEANRILEK